MSDPVDSTTERRCRACTACCTILEIPGFKPAWTKCQHLGRLPNGLEACTIYDERPQACRDFMCAWLQGYGARNDSPEPSKLGLMVTSELAEDKRLGEVAKVYETRSGASGSSRAQKLFRDLLERKGEVVVIVKRLADGSMNPERQIKVPERVRKLVGTDLTKLA